MENNTLKLFIYADCASTILLSVTNRWSFNSQKKCKCNCIFNKNELFLCTFQLWRFNRFEREWRKTLWFWICQKKWNNKLTTLDTESAHIKNIPLRKENWINVCVVTKLLESGNKEEKFAGWHIFHNFMK